MAAIEKDADAAQSFAVNFPRSRVSNSLVQDIDPTTLVLPSDDLIVAGGPPCQGFSSSNQRNRDYGSSQNQLYAEMIRFVDALSPAGFVFENVYGLVEGEKKRILESMILELKRRFTTVDWRVLNAVEHGVPQKRRRVFVVARNGGSAIRWPEPGFQRVSVRDALSDLPVLENGAATDLLPYGRSATSDYAGRLRGELQHSTGHTVSRNAPEIIERYAYVLEGGNWQSIPDYLMRSYADKSRCHTGIYRRLSWSEPSVVIGNFRKNMLIHPGSDRGLSVREAARLQSFPDNFKFSGSIGKRQQQVGNAVPPLLAKAVFEYAFA
jgi:DNA (cytosine-5)-methyltransferase 1